MTGVQTCALPIYTAGEWIIDTPATATTSGSKHKECTVCGYTMTTETIPATGGGEHTHSYGSEWKSDADKHWHECSCGDKKDTAAHTAGEWIIDTPATATTSGSKHKKCTVCGYTMATETIPAAKKNPAKKNPAKKIVAAKKKINAKKGKTAKIVIKVTAKNPKKVTTDAVKVSGKKIKVKKITKKAGKITIKVKALKKGKRIVKIKVGKASTKVTLNVR